MENFKFKHIPVHVKREVGKVTCEKSAIIKDIGIATGSVSPTFNDVLYNQHSM
jgi:hypothetical protein